MPFSREVDNWNHFKTGEVPNEFEDTAPRMELDLT